MKTSKSGIVLNRHADAPLVGAFLRGAVRLIQQYDCYIEIACKGYPKQIRKLQPCGGFVDWVVLDNRKDNRQPKGNENDKSHDKRLHIKEKYAPRKIEYQRDGVDKKCVVFFWRFACENHGSANSH